MASLNATDPILFVGNGGGSMLAEIVLGMAGVRFRVEVAAWGTMALRAMGFMPVILSAKYRPWSFPTGQC